MGLALARHCIRGESPALSCLLSKSNGEDDLPPEPPPKLPWEGPSFDPALRCAVCQIRFRDEAQLGEHLRNKNHKRNLRGRQRHGDQ